MNLTLLRQTALADRTLGEMLIDGAHFCWVLEDPVRPDGVKIWGETAIPAGVYVVRLTMSTRFKRLMPQIMDVPSFDGIRLHGGNGPKDTHGCPLIAFRRVGVGIQGSAEKELTRRIGLANVCSIRVLDVPVPQSK